MLYDPTRHEALQPLAWNEERARQAIRRVVHDTEDRFSAARYWPLHPRDVEGDEDPSHVATTLYDGACGVIWALHYLQAVGAVRLSRGYLDDLDRLLTRNRAWLKSCGSQDFASFLMGDTPIELLAYGDRPDAERADRLAALIAGNLDHPARELMWGSPGTLLAALFLHQRTGEARWANLFRQSAAKLWPQLLWSPEHGCHYWTQDLYGTRSTYLDAVHGFAATASPLIRGRHLLDDEAWAAWQACIATTISRTAIWDGDQASWPTHLVLPGGSASRPLMQFCHGAPGFIICLGDFPGAELDGLLLAAGRAVWAAGPLTKGSNLCHGSGGNGYAFLKLYQRTQDPLWLERARAFAMHGIVQTEADAVRYGQMRYSPAWTRMRSPPSDRTMSRLAQAASSAAVLAALLAGCALPGRVAKPSGMGPTEAREAIVQLLPPSTEDRAGWAADIHAALATLELPSTPENVCAVLAVTEQESGFRADPAVPGLAAIAWKEIDRRADGAGVPKLAVHAALALSSPDGRSYAERIDAVKTERQLSEIFEDFIGMVPLGRTFFASRNPVRTGGPMQVSIAFAEAHAQARPYPYAVRDSVRREVFTRRGGLYFGTAHLLAYDAPYDNLLYRFADFNAGRHASRNAAFQNALSVASGLAVALDGDLLPPARDAPRGETERAADSLAGRLGLSTTAIRRDLEKGEDTGFERTPLYERVFAYAEQLDRRALPRAIVPRIDLHSPKFTRKLTTEWFARRVDDRHRRCLMRIATLREG